MIFLIGGFFIVELVVGLISGSLALQTDAFHMLSDVLALGIGLTAHLLAQKEKNLRYTYGWIRAEIIGSLINSVFLLALCFTIFLEVVEKFIDLAGENGNSENNQKLAQEIDLVLIVAGIGLVINLLGLILFGHTHTHSHSHSTLNKADLDSNLDSNLDFDLNLESDSSFDSFDSLSISYSNNSLSDSDLIQQTLSLNDHAVWLHVLGDTLGSVVVIVTGLLIKYLEGVWRFWLDPVASLLLVIFIGYNSGRLLIKSGNILLHRSQDDGEKLLKEIENQDGVLEVHEFHVWPLTESIQVATLHVQLDREYGGEKTDRMIQNINQIVHRYGIHSCTIQPEFGECLEHLCKDNCRDLQCC
jgi:zinc transporter 1